MAETVTLKSFGEGNDWTSDDGKIALTFYDCVFDRNGSDFQAQWGKKQGTGAPTVGETLEGEFYEKGGKQRFRKASRPQGGGGEASSGGGRSNWQPEGDRDPEKVARITRAHSQNCAVELLKGREDFNNAPKANRQQAIVAWADFFSKDIEQAAAVALTKDGLGATEAIRPAAADGEIVDDQGIPFARPEYGEPFSERLRWLR